MYSYTVAYNYNHILCRFLMTISRRSNMHTNQMYDQLYTYWQWIEVKFKIIYYCYLMTKSKKKKRRSAENNKVEHYIKSSSYYTNTCVTVC